MLVRWVIPRLCRPLLFILIPSSFLAACGPGDLSLPGDSEVAQLRAISGDEQQGITGSLLPQPLVVEAIGPSGSPMAGVAIVFTFDGGVNGGELELGSTVTDNAGRMGATVRLGRNAGIQTVDARPEGGAAGVLARFRLIAVPEDEGGDDPVGDEGEGGGGGGGNGGGGGGGGGGGDGDDSGDDDGRGNGHSNGQDRDEDEED
jgi:hypothetical protein